MRRPQAHIYDFCLDADGDGYGSAGGGGNTCSGTDCDDADPNNWTSCATCVDTDSDDIYDCAEFRASGRSKMPLPEAGNPIKGLTT